MTRRKMGKNKKRSEEGSNTHEKESDKIKTDEGNLQGDINERGQTIKLGTVKSYLIYLWPPTLLDLFISTMFRIELFLYRKVAGRMPLFLEGETSDSLQSKNKKAEESYMKTLKEQTDKFKKLTEEIGSLKESKKKADEDLTKTNEEHTDKVKKLTEENGILKESKKKVDEDSKKTNEEQTDKIKKLTEEIVSLKESNKKADEDFKKTNKKQTDTIEKLTEEIGSLKESNKKADEDFKKTNEEQTHTIEKLTEEIGSLKESNKKADEDFKKTNKEQIDTIEKLTEIGSLKESNKEMEESFMKTNKEQNENFNEEIDSLNEVNRAWQHRFNTKENENAELSDKISTLTKEKQDLETEKQDALRRLTEVSMKLRDNSPHIVDLTDQCRPTKLARMFSELYDNEWTSALCILEEPFGEKYAIIILLDIVMETYGFCEEIVAVSWNVLTDWFLDMSLPGAQHISKWLKDSRKARIRNNVQDVEKDCEKKLLDIFKERDLAETLSKKELQHYMTKCVELCLLMVTTDPPVVLHCRGLRPGLENRGNGRLNQQSSEEKQTKNVYYKNIEEKNKPDSPLSTGRRRPFDKDIFKEYTRRGIYLDYVVWPAMFLHKEGPLLSKGIAQGKNEQHWESR